MPTKRIPLIGALTSRDDDNTRLYGSSQKDQYFKDCCFQVVEGGNGSSVWVTGRNDFSQAASMSATGNGTAVRIWRGESNNYLMSAFGNSNSTIYQNTTSLGTITGQCIHMNETAISAVPTMLMVSSQNRAYYYDVAGATLNEITDGDFPPKQGTPLTITGNFAVLDGYHFIMCTNGQIWHSDLNSISGWTSTSSITAQEYPDAGVGVIRYRNMIAAGSQSSIEFFINAGNAAGAVLNRVSHMTSRIGVMNQHCMLEYGDTFIVVGRNDGARGVFIFSGNQFVKISSDEIDWALEDIGGSQPRINLLNSWGRTYLALQVGDQATNLFVYDFRTKIWSTWVLTNALCKSDIDIRAAGAIVYIGSTVGYPLVNTTTIVAGEIQTARIDMGNTKRKTLNRLRVVGDKTTDTLNVAVSWTDDDYQSYSTARNVNMASVNPELRRCGTFRRRAFKIANIGQSASQRPARLEAIELDYTESSM